MIEKGGAVESDGAAFLFRLSGPLRGPSDLLRESQHPSVRDVGRSVHLVQVSHPQDVRCV
jgi:hypothetical protein